MANLSKRIAEYIKARPSLLNIVKPMATSYMSFKGHRRIGLRHDDLLEDENPIVQEALRRLPPEENYKRAYRVRIAQQCGVTHHDLPRDQWLKPEDDISYLQPIVDQVAAEWAERMEMDSLIPEKKKSTLGSAAKKAAAGH